MKEISNIIFLVIEMVKHFDDNLTAKEFGLLIRYKNLLIKTKFWCISRKLQCQ